MQNTIIINTIFYNDTFLFVILYVYCVCDEKVDKGRALHGYNTIGSTQHNFSRLLTSHQTQDFQLVSFICI